MAWIVGPGRATGGVPIGTPAAPLPTGTATVFFLPTPEPKEDRFRPLSIGEGTPVPVGCSGVLIHRADAYDLAISKATLDAERGRRIAAEQQGGRATYAAWAGFGTCLGQAILTVVIGTRKK